MPVTISDGITIIAPTTGDENYGTSVVDDWVTPVSGHDHTGSGNGKVLGTSALSDNAVTDAKIRLTNDGYLQARNAANSADLGIVKVDASDKIIFDVTNVDATTRTSLGLGDTSTLTPEYYQVTLTSGGAYTTTKVTVNNSTERETAGSYWSVSSGEVTVAQTGIFKVSHVFAANVSADVDDTLSTITIEKDGVTIPGTSMRAQFKTGDFGTSSCFASAYVSITSGDVIRQRCVVNGGLGGSTMSPASGACSLLIERIA